MAKAPSSACSTSPPPCCSLDVLGLSPDTVEKIRRSIRRPNGVTLVTGPTGSGKTTTLYSALRDILTPEMKFVSVEDPIEYQIDGVSQIQVRPTIDLTFAKALRSDPAPGPGRADDRRDPRQGDRHHRHRSGADRPPGAVDASHQQCARHRHTPDGDGRPGVPDRLDGQLDLRPAAGAQSRARLAPNPINPPQRCWRTCPARNPPATPSIANQKAAAHAAAPAIAGAPASRRS